MVMVPDIDTIADASRLEAALIYWALLVISVMMTRRYNGLAKALTLWMLGEAIVSTAILYYGPTEGATDGFRVLRIATGSILLFELGQIVWARTIGPASARVARWVWAKGRDGYHYVRRLR